MISYVYLRRSLSWASFGIFGHLVAYTTGSGVIAHGLPLSVPFYVPVDEKGGKITVMYYKKYWSIFL